MMNGSENKYSQDCIGRERCEELAKSSSLYRKVYSEVSISSSFVKLIAHKYPILLDKRLKVLSVLLDRGNWMGTTKEIRWRFNIFQLSYSVSSTILGVLMIMWLVYGIRVRFVFLNIIIIIIIILIRDKKGRAHILEIQLNRDYPNSPPSLSAVRFVMFLF